MVTAWHLQCREREKPEGNNPGREGGRQRHHRRVHQNSKPVASFCVFTFARGCHTETPANSLAGLSQRSARGSKSRGSNVSALVGVRDVSGFRCPEATDYQFWDWCPLSFKRAAPVRPPRRRITTSAISATVQLPTVTRARTRDR